jgi:hypothetical protein
MNFTVPKLKALYIVIIGVVLAAMVAAGFWFLRLEKLLKVNKDLQASVDQLMLDGSAANAAKARQAVADAAVFVARQKKQWTAVEDRYFRVGPARQPLNLKDLLAANSQMSLEYSQILGPTIRAWIESTGNKLVSSVGIPSVTANPNDINKMPIIVALNGVRVQGTFKSVMNLLRSTRSAKRLILISGVGISATASEVTLAQLRRKSNDSVYADLDLLVYYFPRNYSANNKFEMPGGDTATGGGIGGPMPGGPSLGPRSGMPGMPGGPMPAGAMPGGPSPLPAGAPAAPAG